MTVDWVARLQLAPHPEGGWFRRIHTDPATIQTVHGRRARSTAIHYLLNRQQPLGRLHRNRSGILHFLQAGGPVEYLVVTPAGELQRTVLGPAAAQSLSLYVPGDCWKASRLLPEADCALVSEVVSPGFDEADHAFATTAEIVRDHPGLIDTLRPFLRD